VSVRIGKSIGKKTGKEGKPAETVEWQIELLEARKRLLKYEEAIFDQDISVGGRP